ncbi:MAG: polysaccharide biosynthesis protein [Holosporaceae bacterium]|nr:polysaccharide biosynthesis protein [Holosporaceae bacterium]
MSIDNRDMLNNLLKTLKKLIISIRTEKIKESMHEYFQMFCTKIRELPREHRFHVENIGCLLLSYTVASFFIYPEFNFFPALKEIFSLLCMYGAVFFWFMDRMDQRLLFNIIVGVNACVAPIWFINNSFGVALVTLLVIIFCEFLFFEYLRGCRLFSNAIPVYVICENANDAERVRPFVSNYKVLELIVLGGNRRCSHRHSSMKSLQDLERWLQKINRMPFFPSPRKFLYVNPQKTENLLKLMEMACIFSIPTFKVISSIFSEESSMRMVPVSVEDMESQEISSTDKNALSSAFKGKRVWINYDGRKSIMDLASVMAATNSVDLTILCESEQLMIDAGIQLSRKCSSKNYKIKITNENLQQLKMPKPDVFFYNIPIRFIHSGEENLKETVVRNVLGTKKMISFAQSNHVSQVIFLSSTNALNANNWVGATQRLGELLAQFADFHSSKTSPIFRIIRIPEETTDISGVYGKLTSAIFTGNVVEFAGQDTAVTYSRRDILQLLMKTISFLMKNRDTTSSVYTIVPKKGITYEALAENICNLHNLKKGRDMQIRYNCSEGEEKDLFSIREFPEKTNISGVFRTKFLCKNPSEYDKFWTIEEIENMSTRELISSVFQDLSKKI